MDNSAAYYQARYEALVKEIFPFRKFVAFLAQCHPHGGLSKTQILRMADRINNGGQWNNDHIVLGEKTAIEVLLDEIALLKKEKTHETN